MAKPVVDSLQTLTSSVAFNSGNPANYYWSYGDGQTFTSNTTNLATHAYPGASNNITIKHVVSYGPGCSSDTAIQTIPLISANPSAQFSMSPNPVCEKGGVQFTTTIPAGNLTWSWNFGNGTDKAMPPFTRIYNQAGNYNVQLVVSTPQDVTPCLLSVRLRCNRRQR
jgi:PKD repeat protein